MTTGWEHFIQDEDETHKEYSDRVGGGILNLLVGSGAVLAIAIGAYFFTRTDKKEKDNEDIKNKKELLVKKPDSESKPKTIFDKYGIKVNSKVPIVIDAENQVEFKKIEFSPVDSVFKVSTLQNQALHQQYQFLKSIEHPDSAIIKQTQKLEKTMKDISRTATFEKK
jgi:hypothetical protein